MQLPRVRQSAVVQAAPARPRVISPEKAGSWRMAADIRAEKGEIEPAAMLMTGSEKMGWIARGARAIRVRTRKTVLMSASELPNGRGYAGRRDNTHLDRWADDAREGPWWRKLGGGRDRHC